MFLTPLTQRTRDTVYQILLLFFFHNSLSSGLRINIASFQYLVESNIRITDRMMS
jgi:hypothetical protein